VGQKCLTDRQAQELRFADIHLKFRCLVGPAEVRTVEMNARFFEFDAGNNYINLCAFRYMNMSVELDLSLFDDAFKGYSTHLFHTSPVDQLIKFVIIQLN